MIRVAAKSGLLGSGLVHHLDLPSTGMTGRDVLRVVREMPAMRRTAALGIAVNGRLLREPELDVGLPDGAQVVVAAPQQGIESIGAAIGQALIAATVSVVVSYVVSLLLPKPKPPGVPQERGDDSSPTFAWDGVTTSYGQGLPIPWGLGRHAVGGQVISSSIQTFPDEFLFLLLALTEGPIHRVGDALASIPGPYGGFPGNPNLPTPLLINGNPQSPQPNESVLVRLRNGDLNQEPVGGEWDAPAVTVAVGQQVTSNSTIADFTWAEAEEVASVRVVVTWPSGLYELQTSGVQSAISYPYAIDWRPAGTVQAWSTISQGQIFERLSPSASWSFVAALPSGTIGPIEFRFRRRARSTTPPGQIVDDAVVRQFVVTLTGQYAYPGVALMALRIRATELLQGQMPQVQARCDLALVRVWDASLGWSPYCWDKPAAPFDFMTHAPGRNPAWGAVEYLLNRRWGLGRWWSEDRIDLPGFRRWSIFCDADPNPATPWGEPSFCCDVVADSPRPAWERLVQIMAAGRAAPVMIGNKLSVSYQYRDAHSDALVSVPAKAPVQLFTSTNIEDLRVTWLPRRGRATAIQYQFLNEAKDYAQDVLSVEDPEGTANDPYDPLADTWLPEPTQAYGVVRESQLFREGVFTHRLQRMCTRQVRFVTGPWSLACGVGDLFRLEHEVLRPFAADVPMSCVIEQAQAGHDLMIVDHVVSGTGLRVVYRDAVGAPQEVAVTELTPLPFGRTELKLATPGTWLSGAPAVVGQVAKLTDTYQCVAIGLTQEVKRDVLGLQWTPAAYDRLTRADMGEDSGDDSGDSDPEPIPDSIEVDALPRGGHLLGWTKQGRGAGVAVRVWVRWSQVSVWFLLGESRTGSLETHALAAHQSYEIALADERGGAFPAPEQVTPVTIKAPEFPRQPLPPARLLRAERSGEGILFRWPAQDVRDLAWHELRAGRQWETARPIYRGLLEEVLLRDLPATDTFWLSHRSISGLHSTPVMATLAAAWSPVDALPQAEVDELAATPTGTLEGLVYDGVDEVLELAAASVSGAYTAPELDAGYVAPWQWQVAADFEAWDDITCGELTGLCGDGEAAYRTCSLRPPSLGMPGIKVDDVACGSLSGTCGDVSPWELCGVGFAEAGHIAAMAVESRFHDGDSWGPWAKHADGKVVSQKIQFRVQVLRASLRVQVRVIDLQAKAFL